jgi:formylglycine-generating enzyme required for sulfatase activity
LRIFHIIAAAWLMLACVLAPAHAEKRVALVIGNDRYAKLPADQQLHRAVNDARAVGGALRQIGFEVITGENLDRGPLMDKLGELTQRLAPGDIAFFFFSGHGVALDRVNYILPADVPELGAGETHVKRAALSETDIVAELTGRKVRVAVVVLDAGRNNPFGPGAAAGLPLTPPSVAPGVFALYATGRGGVAHDQLRDGDPNPNSVFTRVLAPLLTKPGLDLADLAREVRDEVARLATTAGLDQWPAYYDETAGGRIYLAGPPPAALPAVSDAERAAQTWGLIQNTMSLAVLDDYLRQFGNVPIYGPLARARREELAKSQLGAAIAPPRGAAPLTAAQERGLRPKDTFRECENCPEMVVVPAGSFTMGSPAGEKDRGGDEGPQHVVTFGRPFGVGKLHVTIDQFAEFVRETAYRASSTCGRAEGSSWRNPGYAQEGSHPVVCVSWDDAKAYVDWLSRKTGRPYRLLSEAEWEYAARGRLSSGAYPRFWFGDDEKELCRYGNSKGVSCNDGYSFTSPAGHYQPNAFGLYDLSGNAWQWTADCWHDSYNGAPSDGSAWTAGTCSGRVVRGGSWGEAARELRSARRLSGDAADGNRIGFRVARTFVP